MKRMENLILIEGGLWILESKTGQAAYDFPFENLFACSHPYLLPEKLQAIARIGAIPDYPSLYERLQIEGISLVHTPEEHQKASELPFWYPLIIDLTPESIWFSDFPTAHQIEQHLPYPLFIKGARQTSKHRASLSIAKNRADLSYILKEFQNDSILHWQSLVCRKFIPLRVLQEGKGDQLPVAFEFRTFWYKAQLAAMGPYWPEQQNHPVTALEIQDMLGVAQTAAARLQIPFLVVDVAQTQTGQWLVIECNDAQESGFAGVSPVKLWQRTVTIERELHLQD